MTSKGAKGTGSSGSRSHAQDRDRARRRGNSPSHRSERRPAARGSSCRYRSTAQSRRWHESVRSSDRARGVVGCHRDVRLFAAFLRCIDGARRRTDRSSDRRDRTRVDRRELRACAQHHAHRQRRDRDARPHDRDPRRRVHLAVPRHVRRRAPRATHAPTGRGHRRGRSRGRQPDHRRALRPARSHRRGSARLRKPPNAAAHDLRRQQARDDLLRRRVFTC